MVGTAITKICEFEVSRTGLNEREAKEAGFAYDVTSIDTTAIAGYMPDAKPMTVKMLSEQDTGRVLGAQIVGGERSAKRIDTIATALHARMSVQEVMDLDLSYAPPFSGVWDPVQVAARRLAREV